jgi:hypothetical protein
MPTTNEDILQTTLTDINKLLTECLSDKEIMKQLDIPKTTYYRYKTMLHREAAEEVKQLIAGSRTGVPKELAVALGQVTGIKDLFKTQPRTILSYEEWLYSDVSDLITANKLGYLRAQEGGLQEMLAVRA